MKNGKAIRQVKTAARDRFAWPGGYPLFIVMSDGGAVCPTCARENFTRIARSTRDAARDGWDAVGADINWEDSDLVCDHCGAAIQPAYTDDAEVQS
jgi:hypothetical protein